MDRDELRASLREMLEETTGETYAAIDDDQDLRTALGLDSVDLFSLVIEIQNAYRIRISSNELATVKTVGDVLEMVEAKLAAPAIA